MRRTRFSASAKALAVGASALVGATPLWWAASPDGSGGSGPRSAPTATSATSAVGEGDFPDPPASSLLHTDVLSVTDADRHGEVWYLLDQTQYKVHRIGLTGEHLGSFGTPGEGPGEFRHPQALAVHGDTIVVADWNIIHLFAPDGRHLTDRPFAVTDCPGPMPTVREMVSVSSGLALLVECVGSSAGARSLVWLVATDGRSRTLASAPPDDESRSLVFDFNSIPVLGFHPGGFLFGNVRDDCLSLFGPDGLRLESVCHRDLERAALPPELAEQYAREAEEVRRYARQRGLGARVVPVEQLWPFAKVFVTSDQRVGYVVPVPSSLAPNGDVGLHRLRIRRDSAWDDGAIGVSATDLCVAGRWVLAVWEDLRGTRLEVYEVS